MLPKKTLRRSKPTRYGKKRYVRRAKKIANRTHMVKRLGQVMTITNAGYAGDPVVDQSAGGAIGIGLPSAWTSGTGFPSWGVGGALLFRADATVDFNDLAALFDRYKLTGVKLDVMYQQNVSIGSEDTLSVGANHVVSTCLPVMNYAYDFDDSQAPNQMTDVTVRGYCKRRVLNANKPFSIFIKPRVLKAAIVDPIADTLAHTSERAPWLDCKNADVRHYGLKFWLSNFPIGTVNADPEQRAKVTAQLTIQPTYYFALRDTQ